VTRGDIPDQVDGNRLLCFSWSWGYYNQGGNISPMAFTESGQLAAFLAMYHSPYAPGGTSPERQIHNILYEVLDLGKPDK
jgi:hypothetical protein